MSDNIEHEAMVRAACLADLGRLRQEELPLSNQARRGPSFAPNKNNGSKNIDPHLKIKLIHKWGSAKIEDDESRQMEGLEIEARPWAKGRVAEAFSSNKIKSGPPPRIPPRKPETSAHGNGNSIADYFKPPTEGWKKCVVGLVEKSPINNPITVKWGSLQNASTPSLASQGVVSKPVQGPVSSNGPSTGTSGNESSMASAPLSTPLESCTPRVVLSFTLHQKGFDSKAVETIIGSGYCQVVPGKNEALGFVSSVVLKVHEENGGFLVFCTELKGDKILDVLDLCKPSLEGSYCKVQATTQERPYYIRFDNDEHVKVFKACLSRVKKAVLLHKKPEPKDSPKDAPKDSSKASPKVSKTVVTGVIVSSPSTATIDSTPTVSTIVPQNVVPTQTPTDTELIPMDDDWDSTNNPQVPAIQAAVNPMVALVRRCLAYFSAEGNFCAGTIAGIEDAIFDQWKSQGFLEDCSEREREAAFAMLRTFVDVELILSGKKPPGKATQAPEQVESSNKRSRRGATQGLGSSCFAKKPFAYEGSFTGPRPRAAYK
ncbi:hypothetical protein ACHAP8_003606 [Fusarium lateritium]